MQYKQVNGTNLLYCYNGPAQEILVYDIDKKVKTGSIPVVDTSFNNINPGPVRSFYVQSADSIFIQRLYSISMLDAEGVIKFRKIINAPESDEWPPLIYSNLGSVFPMYFDSAHKTIFLRQYSGNIENYKRSFFNIKVEAGFSPGDSSFVETPARYPAIYRKDYYGEALLAFREADDSCNVYSFMASPEIYSYNRYTKKLKKHNGKSKLASQEFQPLDLRYKEDMNRKADHLVENPLHMKIVFDRFKGLYYRFLLNGKKLKNDDGTYNEFGDKELIISVFDRQLRLIYELNAGSDYLWYFSFVTPKGLYVLKETATITSHQTTVNGKSFIFDVFDFSL